MPYAISDYGRQPMKIYYEVIGNSQKPPLIFAHGNGNCLDDWKILGFAERLSPHFQLILMDALGYGKSDKPHDPHFYNSEQRAKDVIAVLDHLNISKSHFYGNSIGGSLGFALASLYPERFLSFSIGNAHCYGSSAPGSNLFPEDLRKYLVENGIEELVNYLERTLNLRLLPGLRENFLQNDPLAIAAANTPEWPDYSKKLKQNKVPMLIFGGEKDGILDLIKQCATAIPNSVLKTIPNKDHAQVYWESEIVVPLILDFMAGVKQ